MLQIGDTDKGYHKIFVTINGTIDANNIAGNALKIVRAVDSRFKGGVLKNSVGANLALVNLNSHVAVEDFTCGFGGAGVHVNGAEFIYFRNILTYVNKNNGWEIISTNGVVCNKCISNGDASENQGTGAWVNNAFLLLGIKKYVILVNSEVWTNQGTHLNRVMDIEFDNLDEDIVVWLDNFYFRPDGGLPASLQEVFRVVTYSDKHVVFARDPVILDSGGKPVVNYPNNAGMMMIHGGRLVDVAAPTGYPERVRIRTRSGYVTVNGGKAVFSGDGSTTQFSIAHGLVAAPSRVVVTPCSADAAAEFYVTVDNTYIYVNYSTAPAAGTDNVCLYWEAEV